MSVVIGLRDEHGTVIGCDGRMTNDDHIVTDNVKKWVSLRGTPYAVGLVGQYRGLDLLSAHSGMSTFDCLISRPGPPGLAIPTIASSVREILVNDGWVDEVKDGKPRWLDAEFLIAWPDGLAHVSGTGSIRFVDSFAVIGSGAEYALGALYATTGPLLSYPALRVEVALRAALRFSSSCGGELTVITLNSAVEAAA